MAVRRDNEGATKRDLDLLKQQLLQRIEGNGIKIDANAEKIEANGRKIDANAEKIEANGRKIETNGEKISRLIDRVVENHDAIGKMLTREEYKRDYNQLVQGQDKMMVILLRIDQERAATNAP